MMGTCGSKEKRQEDSKRGEPTENESNFTHQSKTKPDEKECYIDEVMFASENLFKVKKQEMDKQIHRHTGALTFKSRYTQTLGKGTAFLISPNLALTAAHNLFNKETGELFKTIRFYPGQCGVLEKAYEIENLYIPGQFFLNPSVTYDYALLKLSQKVESDNFIPLSSQVKSPKKYQSTKLTVLGYAAQRSDNYIKTSLEGSGLKVYQFGLTKTGAIHDVIRQRSELIHRVSTQGGQSGSPIILHERDELKIVAIHKGGTEIQVNGRKQKFNGGRLITSDLIEQLQIEARRMKAEMFLFESSEKEVHSHQKFPPKSPIQRVDIPRANPEEKKPAPLNNDVLRSMRNFYPSRMDMETSEKHLNEGNVHYQQKNYEKAISSYQKAIDINPNSKQAYDKIQLSYEETNQKQQAMDFYRSEIEKNPYFKHAYTCLGNALLYIDQAKSMEQYRIALSIDQTDATAHFNLARVHYQMGKKSEAIQQYKKTIQFDAHFARAHSNLGFLYLQQNNISQALKHFRTAIQENPKLSLAYIGLGNTLRQTNKVEASKQYCNGITADPAVKLSYEKLESIFAELNMAAKTEICSFLKEQMKKEPKNQLARDCYDKLRLK